MKISKILRSGVAMAVAAVVLAAPASAQSVLKIVLDGEIQVVDPIATTNYRTRDLAYMVFDMLIAIALAAATRPRTWSGVEIWISDMRTMTLTWSAAP